MADGGSDGSQHSDHYSDAAADQAAEMEQLRRQLEAASLQIQDRDHRLAAADVNHGAMQRQAEAALGERDRLLTEASQAADVARLQGQDLSQELARARGALADLQKEREVLQYMQSLEQTRRQPGPTQPTAFRPVAPQMPQDTDQSPVLQVIDQWNSQQQPPTRGAQGNQQRHSPGYHRSGPPHSRAGPPAPGRNRAQSGFANRDIAPSRNSTSSTGGYHIPLPRQMTFDGKTTWQSFILPFKSLADACGWSEEEKLFRLSNSLRDDAAEYAFAQLTHDVVNSFELLELALDARFAEKRTTASYLATLEARKLQPKEKLSEYVADIKKFSSRATLLLTSKQGIPSGCDTSLRACPTPKLRWR